MPDNDNSPRFPSLKDLFESYPVERVKAAIKDLGNKKAALGNEMMTTLADQAKEEGGMGGLEEITPETSPEDAKKIMEARAHLERMASLPDSMSIGGIAKVPAAVQNLGKVIMAPEAAAQGFGQVINPMGGENAAQAIIRYKRLKEALGK